MTAVHTGLILPVRNRKVYTTAILAQLTDQIAQQAGSHQLSVIVVDDGSSDGTPELVAQDFPSVQLLNGDGELWWTGAIALGMRHAVDVLKVDHMVWLNDDITLCDDFVDRLMQRLVQVAGRRVITGGIIRSEVDPDWIVFGGVRAGQPITSSTAFAEQSVIKADTLNGNIAVFPAAVVDDIGWPDVDRFRHYGGDFEYICRAKDAGYTIELSSTLTATTDYQPADVIRYMPLWVQLYFAESVSKKWRVLNNLKSLKSPHNVYHMLNSIRRKQPAAAWWQYELFFMKKLIKLASIEVLPPVVKRRKVLRHLQHCAVPPRVTQVLLP